jgi:hypothetical protein
MDLLVGFVWFFYLLVCPVATLLVLILLTGTCEDLVDLLLRGTPAVLLLALVLGPIWTEIGPMPWWAPLASPKLLNPSVPVQNLVGLYAGVCAAAGLVLGLFTIAVRERRRTSGNPRRPSS